MRVQCRVVRYDYCVLRNQYLAVAKLQGLRVRACGFGDCNGGVETYCLELAKYRVRSLSSQGPERHLPQRLSSAGDAGRQPHKMILWIQRQRGHH